MTKEDFLKDCIDILLEQELVPGMLLFECNSIDYFVISDGVGNLDLSVFLDLLYDDLKMMEVQNDNDSR